MLDNNIDSQAALHRDESHYYHHIPLDSQGYPHSRPYTLTMPPKSASSPETAELVVLFKGLGLTQAKAAEAAKSPKSAAALKDIIDTHGLAGKNVEEKQAVLLASLAVAGSKLAIPERSYAVDAILDGRLKSTDQVSGEQYVSLTSCSCS